MLKSVGIIFRKEMRRVFTDRRLIFTNFILPMISIALIYSVMGLVLNDAIETSSQYISQLAVEHAAPSFLQLAEENPSIKLQLIDNSTAIDEALRANKYDIFLQFPENASAILRNYHQHPPLALKALINPKNDHAAEAQRAVESLLDSYRQQILAARFDNSASYQPFTYRVERLAAAQGQSDVAEIFGTLVPTLLTIFLFAGGMGIGIDSFAGEKERGTMATMLVTPVSRSAIVIGKIVSLMVVALLSTLSSLVGISLSIPFSRSLFTDSTAQTSQLTFSMTAPDMALLALCLLGLVCVFMAAISLTSMYAKNLKEAGTYTSPLYLVVMMMAFTTMMSGASPKSYQLFTPILSNITNMRLIFAGKAEPLMVLYAFVSSLLIAALLVFFANRMIDSEKIVFPE